MNITKYDKISNEELRALVTEARGWKKCECDPEEPSKLEFWSGYKNESEIPEFLPLFSTSRDACEELLVDLTDNEWELMEHIWLFQLRELFPRKGMFRGLMTITARQICIAYLIVKGIGNDN